jgi:hypothetical protein
MYVTSASIVARRACAALAVASAGLHAAMLGHAGVIATGLLATMIVACLYCARELWRAGTARAWVVVALMNLAMIALHLPAPTHHHGAPNVAAPEPSSLMTAATLLALTEVVAAAAALYVGSRGRMVALSGRKDP